MNHGLLTLFNRSMRVDLRGWKGHGFRIAFAAFIYFALLMAHMSMLSFGAPGLRFFSSICYLNLFFIFLAGCSFFATAITEEKEEGTLGLLKMAGMNRGAILLGKSTSRLGSSILLLVIQLPFLLLAITLGGVLYRQIWAAALTLLGFLVFTANVGLFFSVICKRSGGAVGFTALATFARFALPPLWSAVAPGMKWPAGMAAPAAEFTAWFSQTSPGQRLGAIMATGFAEPLISPQITLDFAASLVLFTGSWILFDHFTQSERASDPSRGLLVRRRGKFRFLSAGRTWSNPFLWKEYYFLAGGSTVMVVKFIAYGLIGLAFIAADYWNVTGPDYLGPGVIDWNFVGSLLALSMLAAMGVELAIAASRLFHDEWKWKTLETLLLLPVSVGKIGWSKIAGTSIGLIPALFYLGVAAIVSHDARESAGIAFFTPFGWAIILGALTFLHIVVLVSLFVKWGTLPLAVLISLVLCYGLSPVLVIAAAFTAAFDSAQAGAVPMCGLFIGICAVLQLLIAKRVEILGGR